MYGQEDLATVAALRAFRIEALASATEAAAVSEVTRVWGAETVGLAAATAQAGSAAAPGDLTADRAVIGAAAEHGGTAVAVLRVWAARAAVRVAAEVDFHAAVAADVAEAAVEDVVNGGETMKKIKTHHSKNAGSLFCVLVLIATSSLVSTGQSTRFKTKGFASAEAAGSALIAAAEKFDTAAIKEILGPGSDDIIDTGEPYRDKEVVMEFGKLGSTKQKIALDPRTKTRAFLEIGDDSWPFPVPLVKSGTQWYFDTAAGRQELLNRRIGSNEYDAMNVCDRFVDAQLEYAAMKHEGARVNQYAQKIISTPGKQDGLAWQNADGTWAGHITPETAKVLANIDVAEEIPFRGYRFKILKAQGRAAQGGAFNYVQNGAMIGGFALLAYPSVYQVTGVKSFIVNHEGVIYESDLGPTTLKTAQLMETFNPDRAWTPVPSN